MRRSNRPPREHVVPSSRRRRYPVEREVADLYGPPSPPPRRRGPPFEREVADLYGPPSPPPRRTSFWESRTTHHDAIPPRTAYSLGDRTPSPLRNSRSSPPRTPTHQTGHPTFIFSEPGRSLASALASPYCTHVEIPSVTTQAMDMPGLTIHAVHPISPYDLLRLLPSQVHYLAWYLSDVYIKESVWEGPGSREMLKRLVTTLMRIVVLNAHCSHPANPHEMQRLYEDAVNAYKRLPGVRENDVWQNRVLEQLNRGASGPGPFATPGDVVEWLKKTEFRVLSERLLSPSPLSIAPDWREQSRITLESLNGMREIIQSEEAHFRRAGIDVAPPPLTAVSWGQSPSLISFWGPYTTFNSVRDSPFYDRIIFTTGSLTLHVVHPIPMEHLAELSTVQLDELISYISFRSFQHHREEAWMREPILEDRAIQMLWHMAATLLHVGLVYEGRAKDDPWGDWGQQFRLAFYQVTRDCKRAVRSCVRFRVLVQAARAVDGESRRLEPDAIMEMVHTDMGADPVLMDEFLAQWREVERSGVLDDARELKEMGLLDDELFETLVESILSPSPSSSAYVTPPLQPRGRSDDELREIGERLQATQLQGDPPAAHAEDHASPPPSSHIRILPRYFQPSDRTLRDQNHGCTTQRPATDSNTRSPLSDGVPRPHTRTEQRDSVVDGVRMRYTRRVHTPFYPASCMHRIRVRGSGARTEDGEDGEDLQWLLSRGRSDEQ